MALRIPVEQIAQMPANEEAKSRRELEFLAELTDLVFTGFSEQCASPNIVNPGKKNSQISLVTKY